MAPRELLLARIRGEYREMPGLRLTFPQACRLWQVDAVTCEAVLQALLAEHFLARTKDDRFVAGAMSHVRPIAAKATLTADPSIARLRHPA